MNISSELAQDRRARGANARDEVHSIGNAGSCRLVCWHHRWNCVMNRDRIALRELAGNVLPELSPPSLQLAPSSLAPCLRRRGCVYRFGHKEKETSIFGADEIEESH